jgi:hypothetical protein
LAAKEPEVVARLIVASREFEIGFSKVDPEFDRRIKDVTPPSPDKK